MSFQWISENRVAICLNKRGRGIEIWKIDESTTSTKKLDKRFQHERDWISHMAWDERTKYLAVCSDDRWIKIWSMDSDRPIHKTKVDGRCWRLAWRPNGKSTDDEGVDAARKSADNFILACRLDEGEIVIWTPLDLKEKTRILSLHSSIVHSMSFSPDGRFLASTDEDWKLIIWATENWETVYIGEGQGWGKPFSWLSPSTDVPNYKLTFESDSKKVFVVEHVDGQC
ncbi:F-box-like/WD repeat-containing protein TBL1XR1 [Daphnia pulicaria]|uniref:F-box-like/WD repeat-containing protein TBL1XR1 n=1 Tax=Daphnia pulicaria TaxID=35523 RepID=UPI001EEC88B0|nr:F-box-like/WD repeat-containing protein TBL1XR1 [Daphnia pulicaria]